MARRIPDGTTVAGTLKASFDLKDNFGNQDIVESEDFEDTQPLPEEYEIVSSSIVNR